MEVTEVPVLSSERRAILPSLSFELPTYPFSNRSVVVEHDLVVLPIILLLQISIQTHLLRRRATSREGHFINLSRRTLFSQFDPLKELHVLGYSHRPNKLLLHNGMIYFERLELGVS